MAVGVRLEEARKRVGLSRSALARRSGLSLRQIRRIVRGQYKTGPGRDTVERLAMALDVRPGWLSFGEGAV